jgi:queuine tRNA-ribosyltransferase
VTPGFSFSVAARDGDARVGLLGTPHGALETPTFMPVGTQGSVKTLTPEEVAATGARIVLGNTYHLWIRPGAELIERQGGLHAFTRWPHAMLTDSGGFQAFSLAERRTVSDEGFVFKSHLDGRKLALTPEVAMRVQGQLGADIAMQLDVCPPGGAPRADVEAACRRTTAWAKRCLAAKRPEQAVFGIVQGGTDVALRKAHLEELAALDFDGLALGGLSVGEPVPAMHDTMRAVGPLLDQARPRYVMGIGTQRDVLAAIASGIDMFDCVLPTRNARNGQALTRQGKLVIKQARYRDDPLPIDPACGCAACRGGYSRAYLRHLYLSGEILVLRLFSQHNLFVLGELVAESRQAIRAGRFESFRAGYLERLGAEGKAQ